MDPVVTNTMFVPAAEVCCPLCQYSLRGLTEPRCPKCGYAFDWDDVRDPTRRLHPYLFEHHANEPVRSFFRTAFGGLLPARFWRTLHPARPSRPRRLLTYHLATVVFVLAPASCHAALALLTGEPVWPVQWSPVHGLFPPPLEDLTRLHPGTRLHPLFRPLLLMTAQRLLLCVTLWLLALPVINFAMADALR